MVLKLTGYSEEPMCNIDSENIIKPKLEYIWHI